MRLYKEHFFISVGVGKVMSLQDVVEFTVEVANRAVVPGHFAAVVPQVGVDRRLELVGFFAVGTHV